MTTKIRYILLAMLLAFPWILPAEESLPQVIEGIQPKLAKIHGAGGVRGLEAYHTGLLISESGHILTAWNYVLDTENVSVTLHDGRHYLAKLVGIDPQLEIAVLKIEAENLTHFSLGEPRRAESGEEVLAVSNLYGVAAGDEWLSAQRGILAGKLDLAARRGAFPTPYRGQVYLLDAITNNPGATGGALTDSQGRLLGMLGKELRDANDNTWLNYAIPLPVIAPAVAAIQSGKMTLSRTENVKRPAEHYSLAMLGVELVPDVLPKTPPFIDRIVPDSPAFQAGLRTDDLIVFIGGKVMASRKAVVEELSFIDRLDDVRLTIRRGQELLEVTLRAR